MMTSYLKERQPGIFELLIKHEEFMLKLYNSIASNCVQLPGSIEMSALTHNSSDVQSQMCTTLLFYNSFECCSSNRPLLLDCIKSRTAKLAGGQTTQINASTC